MSTYRERRERRAERRRDWAASRESKADAAHDASSNAVAGIPFGQPIIRGHYSQRRHENAIERSQRQASKAIEHSKMADKHLRSAETIEAQLERSIYDDDPDAIERLRERVEDLEAKRQRIKAENAEYRKAHKAELKGMTAYQKDQALPHPAYVLTNLGGNINRNKKRLASLEAR